ncbi:MAG: phenyltransferase domain-containing protein [Desulfobacterales bacterium]|nr:phenyltransferase domain-containing protein [Desulfobacterales bacterium]
MKYATMEAFQANLFNIDAIAGFIVQNQKRTGEIPWSHEDKTDAWDMIEALMGMTIGGYYSEAKRGFDWLQNEQLNDGSWYASYKLGKPHETHKDANITSYIAVGAFHHFLVTKDIKFLKNIWNSVKRAIDFTISLQSPSGEIYWAIDPKGNIDKMSLLTGSSSIYMSLKCSLAIAAILNKPAPEWKKSFIELGDAIKNRRYLFNMGKSRFSMDWFYPVLSGALEGKEAQKRIDKYWKKFVVEGMGVRCVSDEPWVTIAETCEFVLSLNAIGNFDLARIVFNWIIDKIYEDGSFWCGFTFPNMVIWPEDKTTWTNAVALMAADALYNLTPANQLFCHNFWQQKNI